VARGDERRHNPRCGRRDVADAAMTRLVLKRDRDPLLLQVKTSIAQLLGGALEGRRSLATPWAVLELRTGPAPGVSWRPLAS
jgi:hypothetical protein